jgi:6-phosphogluconolactonase
MVKRGVVLFFLCVSIASWINCGTTVSHFVYASTPGSNQIAAYREDPNSGVLTALPGSPFPAGNGATSIAVHPSAKFFYVANPGQGENDISLFNINADGSITEVTPRTAACTVNGNSACSFPEFLAMDPAGSFLYVANIQSQEVSAFSIDSKGALTAVAGSPFPVGLAPTAMKLNPAGNVMYLTGGNPSVIAAFSLSAGKLTIIQTLPTNTSTPEAIVINPAGNLFYTANTADSTIGIFTIASNGTLTETSGSPFTDGTGASPLALLIDSSGTYLYVANEASNNIAVYTITSGTGALTQLSTSPFGSETAPSFLAEDPSGKYLLVGSQSSSGIQAFGVDTKTGTISTIATYATGNTPTSIVVVK